MSCIINASNRREPANCSIKSFLYRTTFRNDHLQLAENSQKFAISKRKCDRPSPWKTVNMRRKNRFVFNFSDKKSNREVVSKAGESAYFSNMIRKSGNGPKIQRITIYGGELTGMDEQLLPTLGPWGPKVSIQTLRIQELPLAILGSVFLDKIGVC